MNDSDPAVITVREWREVREVITETHETLLVMKSVCEHRPETCELRFRKRNGNSREVSGTSSLANQRGDGRVWVMWSLGQYLVVGAGGVVFYLLGRALGQLLFG